VGLGATVGTLQTGYPRINTPNQDKEQGKHPHVAMCFAALDLSPLPMWAPVLPCVLQLWTLLSYRGGLRHYHVSHYPEPRLPTGVGSGATTCPVPPGLSSRPRRAPALPHVPWLQTPPHCWGELRCFHVPLGSLWAVGLI
jgi:hypothetical protein